MTAGYVDGNGTTDLVVAENTIVELLGAGDGTFPDERAYVPTGGWYMVIFFALLAIESWMAFQAARPQQAWEADDRLPWESDPDAWKRR